MTDEDIVEKLLTKGLTSVYKIRHFTASLDGKHIGIEIRTGDDPAIPPNFRCIVNVTDKHGRNLEHQFAETESTCLSIVKWNMIRKELSGETPDE